MIVEHGTQVEVYGRIEHLDSSGRLALWVLNPWEPERQQRLADGSVEVVFQDATDLPDDDTIVHVTGIWTGVSIDHTSLLDVDTPAVTKGVGPPDKAPPSAVGERGFIDALREIEAASMSRGLGTGGTLDFGWCYVLFVTPELLAAQRSIPMRVDLFAATSPVIMTT